MIIRRHFDRGRLAVLVGVVLAVRLAARLPLMVLIESSSLPSLDLRSIICFAVCFHLRPRVASYRLRVRSVWPTVVGLDAVRALHPAFLVLHLADIRGAYLFRFIRCCMELAQRRSAARRCLQGRLRLI